MKKHSKKVKPFNQLQVSQNSISDKQLKMLKGGMRAHREPFG